MAEKEKENIVKARYHYGSNSMDITIPSGLVKKANINDGDLFRVVIIESNDRIVIEYERVYKSKQKQK